MVVPGSCMKATSHLVRQGPFASLCFLLLCALLLGGACATVREPARDPTDGWLELRSDHFRLRTNLGSEAAAELISALEDNLLALARAVHSGEPPAAEVNVVAFASAAEVREFAPHPAFYTSS